MKFEATPLKIGILTAGILGLGYVIKQLLAQ